MLVIPTADSVFLLLSLLSLVVGTEETLSAPNIRERALEFYKKYYSANIMTLVLLSNTGLDELEASARKYFSEVPNFDVVLPTLSVYPPSV